MKYQNHAGDILQDFEIKTGLFFIYFSILFFFTISYFTILTILYQVSYKTIIKTEQNRKCACLKQPLSVDYFNVNTKATAKE